MSNESHAAIASARYRRRHRRQFPFHLVFLLIVVAAVVELLVLRGTPQVLLDLAERNPETQEYVQNYDKYKKRHFDIDLSGDITPGTVPHFLQWDKRWGYEKYGGVAAEDMMGLSGCGPTALSMVAVALTGNLDLHPLAVAELSQQGGHYSPGSGTSWSLMTEGSRELGLTCREVPLHEGSMVSALDSGELLIASVGPGYFTEKGHFIVLCGWDGEAFEIRDPNSKANTAKRWSYSRLEDQIRGLWAFKP